MKLEEKLAKVKPWQWVVLALIGFGIYGSLQPKSVTPPPINETKNLTVETKVVIYDGCNQDIAVKYIDYWNEQNTPVRGTIIGRNPAIISTRAAWQNIGEEGQLITAAIVDCVSAGPGKHLSYLPVLDLQQNIMVKYDGAQLSNFRKMAKRTLSHPPQD